MRDLKFTKLQGSGNDFLVVYVDDLAVDSAPAMAVAMCHRNYGAGADGLIFVTRTSHDDGTDFRTRIFNSDGSEAGISGNGTRCVAAYVYAKRLWSAPEVRIGTSAGTKAGKLARQDDLRFEFEFDMGEPRFASHDVPMALDIPLERIVRYPLHIGGDMIEVTCLSMGNPQCIIFVTDLDRVALAELGPLLEHHPAFPDRANVEFVRVLSGEEIEIRIWERGAGHTLSSGTGSCASAVASVLNGHAARRVKVNTEGGPLWVDWRENNRVFLTGPAEVIYDGRWMRAD